MKAKISPRIQIGDRPILQDFIPLDTPFIVNIDPSDRCNLQCKFCPTGDRELMRSIKGRNCKPMSFNLFRKIVGDICKFPKPIKVLRLYKDGEPLANPRFADMIRLAKQSSCCEVVDTTTNAVLLSPKKTDEIIEAGLDRINISVYGVRREQYEQFCRTKIDFDQLVYNIGYLYKNRKQCKVFVKINGDVISEEDKKRFFDLFGDICDEIFVEHIMNCWPQFDFNNQHIYVNQTIGIYGQPIKEVLVCPYIFYSFSINSDGIASACFLDWQRKLLIGDIKKQSAVEIWHGQKLRELQIMMLRGERKSHSICGNCDQLRRGMPDDIDRHRINLLQKLRRVQWKS
jgi:MoaA/NifB/PqqE/SkfB family radical SAM enzyme